MSPDDIPLLFPKTFRSRKSVLRYFHAELCERVTRGRAFTCLITGDAELRRLNQHFLGKNHATDVLSFPSGGVNGNHVESCGGTWGDLAISLNRAKAQAAEHGHSTENELRILMLHGALHLAGFDHEADEGEMARAELRWRKRFGLPTGLIERSAGGTLKNGNVKNGRLKNRRAKT